MATYSLIDAWTDPVDASTFPGSTAGQQVRAAVDALAVTGGTIDCRRLRRTQVWDVDVFGNLPIYHRAPLTLQLGPDEVRLGVTQTLRSHLHFSLAGTRLVMKDAAGARVTGVSAFRHAWNAVGFGGAGNGIIATDGGGTITKASASAVNWNYLEPEQLILLHGQVPRLGRDDTLLNGAIGTGDTTITVDSTAAWMSAGTVRCQDEIITYTSKNATQILGCTRGGMGSTAASHADNAVIERAVLDSYIVESISGDVLTLGEGRTTDLAANNLDAYLGPIDIVFDGYGTIDGNKDPGADDSNNPMGIDIQGGRFCYIGPGLKFVNWDHGGVALRQCADSEVYGDYQRNGRAGSSLGSSVWMFGGNKNCTAVISAADGHAGIIIDDRTTAPQDTDNANVGCVGLVRRGRRLNRVVHLEGTLRCHGRYDVFNEPIASAVGITLSQTQWATPGVPTDNILDAGLILGPGVTTDVAIGSGVETGNNVVIVRRKGGVVSTTSASSGASLLTPPHPYSLTYGTTVNIDASRSEECLLSVTDGVAFTLANPTAMTQGRMLYLTIGNASGGAMGAITWGSEYRLAGAFTNPANGQARCIVFKRMGALIREQFRTAADQAIA